MTCTVAQCAANRDYALKTVQRQHRYEWLREVHRMRRLPPLSVLQSVFATADLVSLLPRLWPLPQHMETSALVRMKHDISAALELMHQHNMVHADIHVGNIMLRPQPACYVLIDYGGCSGADPRPMRTAYGDYYRLAQTIKAQIHRGERPHTGSRKRTKTLPHHVDKELQNWIDREARPVPTSPSSPFPPGTWIHTAINPQVLVCALLWNKACGICRDSAIFRSPDHKLGNDDGTFVDEVAGGIAQGTGSWESRLLEAAITALPDTDAEMLAGTTRYVPLEDRTSIVTSASANVHGPADSARPASGAWAGALRFAADVLQEVAKDFAPPSGPEDQHTAAT
ncbi:tag-125, partial [Symbiodinium sp. CCMP2456]